MPFFQINTNGIISMDSPFTQFSPELFPVDSEYLVAPFWADVDIAGGTGDIRYQVYSSGSALVETVNTFINNEEDFNFIARWMLVAEWDSVSTFGGPTSQASIITFLKDSKQAGGHIVDHVTHNQSRTQKMIM